MAVHPHDLDVGQGDGAAVGLDRGVDADAELALLHAGGDVGMRLRVHVGIDAKAHRRHHAHGPGHLVQHLHLLLRLDVEHQNAGAQRILHLIPRLAHAREDHLARVGAGLEHPEELAAGNDVETGALVHEGAQHPKVGVGLDREADQMAARGKGLVETPEGVTQLGKAVHVHRRPHRVDDVPDRHVLAIHRVVPVRETILHGCHSTLTSFDGPLAEPSDRRTRTRYR